MAEDRNVLIQDDEGNSYYPHGKAKTVFMEDGESVEEAVSSHAADKNNPHGVTKGQTGLGNVQNYPIASQAQAEAGNANNAYMTPQRTKQAVDTHQAVKSVAGKTGAVTLTKADVGLGNVDNAKQATKAEFDSHVGNRNNPHSVTKAQVGLGSVPDHPVASQAEAESGTASNRAMTPQRTKQAIDALQAVKSVSGKTGAISLTKGDVGLGNLDNVRQAAKVEFDNHVTNRSNPHSVTAGQINAVNKSGDVMNGLLQINNGILPIIGFRNGNTPGTNYPAGITMFSYSSNNDSQGYPISGGTVINFKVNNARFVQYLFSNGSTGVNRIWTRTWYETADTLYGWSDWKENWHSGEIGRIQRGSVTVPVRNGSGYVNITFPRAFSTFPSISVTLRGSGVPAFSGCGASHISTTGFRLYGSSLSGGNLDIPYSWIAIGD